MNGLYSQRTYKLIEMKFTKQTKPKSFPKNQIGFKGKKLVLLHQSFLSFRLANNIAKQAHSPPK
jgi:hypothetical protein